MPKFLDDKVAILNSDSYKEVFEKRGLKFIRIRRTKDFSKLVGQDFEIAEEHVWTSTDSLFKLSYRFFGEYDLWWTIAMINGKPTDAHYSIGDIVYIPKNPDRIMEMMR
jgi:hypothetical protein